MNITKGAQISLCAVLALVAAQSLAEQNIIVAKDSKAMDLFGYHAAISENTLLIGAPKVDGEGKADTGAAYVFVLGENGWYQQAKLVAEPSFAEDMLGGNVALSNDIAVLGVMRRDDKGKNSGAVAVFERRFEQWVQTQMITAPDAKPGDAFGQSVSLTDNHLVIGAPRHDAGGADSGAAYVYERVSDSWVFQTKIEASDGAAGDVFGISVAIDDETVVVGADLHDGKAENAGAAYVYVLDGEQWKQEAKLTAVDGADTDLFGVRVSISNDTALIAARRDDIEGIGVDAGSAYIFERNNGKWAQKVKLISPDGRADDRFGRGVALSENMALISAMNHDANGTDTGASYIYKKDDAGWKFMSKITAKESFPNDRFGWNVGMANGMAVVTAPNYDGKGEDSGAVLIQYLNKASN
ncbi:FG-GAP repeat protein [Alteromonas gracilis]|uniref:FG-GAP repeat protein n=1 Tax=Alteromonas gracilis TaxID=1479524 RepID=UPI0030D41A69